MILSGFPERILLVAAACVAGLACGRAHAQSLFDSPFRAFDVASRWIPAEASRCIATADLDGDGYPDVITGRSGGNPPGLTPGIPGVTISINEGPMRDAPSTFLGPVFYRTQFDIRDLAMVDLDNDGDLDIAGGSYYSEFNRFGGNITLLFNRGDGTFTQPPTYLAVGPRGAVCIAAGDFDGDGDPDLAAAAGGSSSVVLVLANNGVGGFSPPVSWPVPAGTYLDLEVADFDGDGDLDIAAANRDPAQVSLLRNDGSGGFHPPVSFVASGAAIVPHAATAVLDADLDGDVDLLFTLDHSSSRTEGYLALLRNDGTGSFRLDRYPFGLPYQGEAFDVAAADLNGDGYPDAIGGQQFEAGMVVMLNDGAGGFGRARMVASVNEVNGVAVADLDSDGDADALTINRSVPLLGVHDNPGDGLFATRPTFGDAFSHQLLEVGDVDNDGHLDVVTSHAGAASSTVNVLLGAGDGTFRQSYQTPRAVYGFAKFRDLDGDGLLDLLFASAPRSPPYQFYTARGNGDGTFQPTVTWPLGSCGNRHPGAFDLDNDGDLDVVVTEDRACSGQTGTVCYVSLNYGNGTFAPPMQVQVSGRSRNVVGGDFDADGNIDLIVLGSATVFLRGRGDGTFFPETLLPGFVGGQNAVVSDFDGDGFLDMASIGALSTSLSVVGVSVHWGNGAGGFVQQIVVPLTSVGPHVWIEGMDLNGDGRLDLVCDGIQDAHVVTNLGGRAFEHVGRFGLGRDTKSVHPAQLDGDGVVDLIAVATNDLPPSGTSDGVLMVPGSSVLRVLPCQAPLPAIELQASAPILGTTAEWRIDDPVGRTPAQPGSATVLVIGSQRLAGGCGALLPGFGPGTAPAELFADVSAPFVVTPAVVERPWPARSPPHPDPNATDLDRTAVDHQGLVLGSGGSDPILTTGLQVVIRD